MHLVRIVEYQSNASRIPDVLWQLGCVESARCLPIFRNSVRAQRELFDDLPEDSGQTTSVIQLEDEVRRKKVTYETW